MKKLIVVSAIVGMATLAHAVGVYIPQGERKSLGFAPLAEGELCWLPNMVTEKDEDGNETEVAKSATLYLGNGTVDPLRVLDPGALRGTVQYEIDGSEYSIGTDPNWVTSGNGTYQNSSPVSWMDGTNSVNSVTGTVYITVSSRYVIDNFTYSHETPTFGSGMSYNMKVDEERNGNMITLHITSDNGCSWIKLSNFKVTVHDVGEGSWVNDLMARTWKLKDQYGIFNFADLRYWTTHLYDGNRGEHWANYNACNNLFMNGKKIYMDTNVTTSISYNNKKFSISMWGINAMQVVEGNSSDVYDGTLDITAIDKQNDTYRMTYLQAITKNGNPDFDPTQLIVQYSKTLEPNNSGARPWEYLINGQDFTVTDYGNGTGVVDIPYGIYEKSGFYRLIYNGVITEIIQVVFNAPVVFNSDVIMKSPNGNRWKLKVDNNGNLSTEAVQ